MSEIPKWSARMKSPCPQRTWAAPINACKIRKNIAKMERSFVSLLCPIAFQDQTARTTIKIPTAPVTMRCENSMRTSGVISSGINCPLHPGQCLPHPIPLSVFVTSAPPNRISSIPIVEATPNHFKYLLYRKTRHLL